MVRRRAERHRPREVAHSRSLGGPHEPVGGEPVELLERRARLVALGSGQVHDGAHAAHRVAERARIGEIAARQVDPHPLRAEAPDVAHQAAHGLAAGDQPAQDRGSEHAGGAGEEDHTRKP